jgi:hypothetical protein
LIAFLSTSCQPTPEEPVVVNKANGELEKIIVQQTPLPEATLPPLEKVQESFKGKDERVTIYVDAEVMIPNAKKFPVVEIVPDEISMDFVKKAVDVLMEGKKVYEPRTQLSKPEIESKILELEQALADPENSKSDGLSSGDPETVKEVTKMFKDRIKIFRKLYKDAPAEYIRKESEFEFKPSKYYEDKRSYEENVADWSKDDSKQAQELLQQYEDEKKIILDARLDDDYYGRVEVSSFMGKLNAWSRFDFTKAQTINENVFCPMPFADDWNPTTLSEDEASDKIQNLMSNLGLDNMVMTMFSPCDYKERDENGNPIGERQVVGYSAIFQRLYGKIAALGSAYMFDTCDDETYGPRFLREEIRVQMLGDKIVYFKWQNPVKQTKTENENVAILPFEDIMKVFRKNMSLMYNIEKLSRDNPSNDDHEERINKLGSARVDIDKIELGMVRIAVKNELNTYRMVPAWRFYGKESLARKGDKLEKNNYPHEETVYLTLNAIDGSIINFQQGH